MEGDTTYEENQCGIQYEYLDHTADVQLHAWGADLKEAFAQCAMAMYGYMTEIDYVEELTTHTIEATGDDMLSLLFQFLDECLFNFCTEPFFIARRVVVEEFNTDTFTMKATCYGEEFDLDKHPQGTEVKAITYSNMQAHEPTSTESPDGQAHVYGEEFDLDKHPQGTEVKAITYSNMQAHEPTSPESPDGQAHVFVVIDI